ncbi:MAG: AbrB/MazE/SpoVT family DNA-binding domain-containing protein [Archaeoglobaceae archaeon]
MVPNLAEIQKFWEEVMRVQREFMETLSSMLRFFSGFSILSKDIAVFRAKIQTGGRISIPEAEKIALGLQDGDVVKVIIVKEGGERYGNEGVSGSG